MIAVYPGSFDPPTVGHLDLIRRGSRLYAQLVVLIMRNPGKPGRFPLEQRVALMQRCCAGLCNVRVETADGLTVEAVRQLGAGVMLRGLRAESDFGPEFSLAHANLHIDPQIETVFLMGRPEHAAVSSSVVRELGSHGCPLHGYVPEEIEAEVLACLRQSAV